MSQFNGWTGKILAWVATAFLGLLTFIGAGLYNDQKYIAAALTENTVAIKELAAEFHLYVVMNGQRIETMEKRVDKALDQ